MTMAGGEALLEVGEKEWACAKDGGLETKWDESDCDKGNRRTMGQDKTN